MHAATKLLSQGIQQTSKPRRSTSPPGLDMKNISFFIRPAGVVTHPVSKTRKVNPPPKNENVLRNSEPIDAFDGV